MQLQPTPRPEHVLRVSARLITSSTILHLSVEELERAINQEQLENPAFEVEEQRVCLFCGTRMFGQSCTTCGHFAQPEHSISEMPNSLELPVETAWSSEEPGRRLSDEKLARLMHERGIPMARRTVTKYREEMGIGSSRGR
jgi:RNA polymerase sigma-54 factor